MIGRGSGAPGAARHTGDSSRPRVCLRVAATLCLLSLVFVGASVSAQTQPQGKRRIAVMDFRDQTNQPQWAVGRGMRVEFETKLVKTGLFDVIERERLDQIMQEQGFGATGMVDAATAAQIGKLLGVEAMIMGSVTQFNITKTGITLPFLGTVVQSEAIVQIQIRLVDTNTGSIKLAEQATGKASSTAAAITMEGLQGLAFGSADFHQTILGQATQSAVDQLITKILKLYPIEGYVVAVEGTEVWTDLGQGTGVSPGMKLEVYRETGIIKHPVTGAVLSSKKQVVATLTVVTVEENVSICTCDAQGDLKKIQIGDRVRLK